MRAQLCPQLCPRVASLLSASSRGRWCEPSCAPSCAPVWRAYGWQAQEVGGASPAVPPAVPSRGEPMVGKLRRSVVRA